MLLAKERAALGTCQRLIVLRGRGVQCQPEDATRSKVGAGPSPHHIDLAHRAKWLMRNGVDIPAHIDAMTSTGIIDKPGGTEYMITLTVSPAGGDPHTVTTNQYVYPSAPFNEGEDVTVKVDPDYHDVVMILGKA